MTQCLEEFQFGDPHVKIPTTSVMDAMEQLYSSISSLIDVRKSLEKLNAEVKAKKPAHFHPPSLKRVNSDSLHTPRDLKKSKLNE